MMGPLPEERITQSRLFKRTGIDFAGPFHVKIKTSSKNPDKVYSALLICFATKAIHLEVASDLRTAACIAVLKRFVRFVLKRFVLKRFVLKQGRVPEHIFSDIRTNFVGTINELLKLKLILSKKRNSVSQFVADNGTLGIWSKSSQKTFEKNHGHDSFNI